MNVGSVAAEEAGFDKVDDPESSLNDAEQKANGVAEKHLSKSATSETDLKDRTTDESGSSLGKWLKSAQWSLGFDKGGYIQSLLEKGDLPQALEAAKAESDNEKQANLLQMVVKYYLEKGSLCKAFEVSKAASDNEKQANLLQMVVKYVLDSERKRQEAFESQRSLSSWQDSLKGLFGFGGKGDTNSSLNRGALSEAFEAAKAIENNNTQANLLALIIEYLIDKGNLPEATKAAKAISDPERQQEFLDKIADVAFANRDLKALRAAGLASYKVQKSRH